MPLEGDYEPSTRDWVREQVDRYESSGGREANTLRDTGIPVVVVTMRGNRSGKIRKIALMRVEHDGEYALVGSVGGAPRNPNWVHNLRADPDSVMVQDGTEPFDVTVREVTDDERAIWFERAIAVYPLYADYEARARSSRVIPVFIASRKG
jgi:deazaflavin-dependent oxidoreductase (nitroreductase family)